MDVVTLALSKQYTKEQINNLLSVGFMPVVVDTLPEVSAADSNKIYLVPSEKAEGDNNYLEYLAIEDAWECIGSTAINFEEYAKITDVDAKINAQGVYSLNASRIAEMKTKVGAPSATYINIAMIYMAYGCGVYKLDENSVTFKMTSSNQRTLGKGTIIIISGGTKFCWIISGGTSGPQMDFFYNSSSSAPTSYSTYPDKWTYTTLSEAWVQKLATIGSLVSEADVKTLISKTKGYLAPTISFSGNANNMIGGNGQFLSWSGTTVYYLDYINHVWRSYTVRPTTGTISSLSNAGAFGNGYFLIKTTDTAAGSIGFLHCANAAGLGDYNTKQMWYPITLPDNLVGKSYTKMYYVNNRFYLLNESGEGAFSEDGGHTWTLFNFPSVTPSGFTYGLGIYLMTTTTTKTLRSEDGINWEEISTSAYKGGIAFHKDRFMVPYGGTMSYTTDGRTYRTWESGKSYNDGPVCEGIDTFA